MPSHPRIICQLYCHLPQCKNLSFQPQFPRLPTSVPTTTNLPPLLPNPGPPLRNPRSASWSNVVRRGRSQFPQQPPQISSSQLWGIQAAITDHVLISASDTGARAQELKCALMGHFFGEPPTVQQLRQSLPNTWNLTQPFRIIELENYYLLFLFSCEQERIRVLPGGNWNLNGFILQVMQPRPFFRPSEDKVSSRPTWIQFPGLIFELHNLASLLQIAGHFSSTLHIDEASITGDCCRSARVCVDMDITSPLKQGIWIGTLDGNKHFQQVTYYVPMFCFRCGLIGHRLEGCLNRAPQPLLESVLLYGPWMISRPGLFHRIVEVLLQERRQCIIDLICMGTCR